MMKDNRTTNNEYNISSKQKVYIGIKRIFDILFSILGLIVLLFAAILIKLANLAFSDNEPLFYCQTRVGKDDKLFNIYKFRTMTKNATEELEDLLKNEMNRNEWDKYQKLQNDPRVTKVGGFLRKHSFDEIPQFINILKGDMSLVGPRPLVPGELEAHNGTKLYQLVKPGLTSWWACNGRSDIDYAERLNYEYYYVKNFSLLLDIKCIIKTIPTIFNKSGAR